jgi:GGDEF domain-containing protein
MTGGARLMCNISDWHLSKWWHNTAARLSTPVPQKNAGLMDRIPAREMSQDFNLDWMAFRQSLDHQLEIDGPCALILFEIDGLASIEKEFGDAIYSLLLAEIGDRLRASELPGGAVARLIGREFALVVSALHSESGAEAVALRFIQALEKPIGFPGGALRVATCIGVAHAPYDGWDAETIIGSALSALAAARADLVAARAIYGSDWRMCYRDAGAHPEGNAGDHEISVVGAADRLCEPVAERPQSRSWFETQLGRMRRKYLIGSYSLPNPFRVQNSAASIASSDLRGARSLGYASQLRRSG